MKDVHSRGGIPAFLVSIAVAVCGLAAQGATPPRAAVPIEPTAAILEAFRAHSLVMLESHHGNVEINAFQLSLIRDPRFAAMVNDIVVEFGNARYQDIIGRFVEGENVPAASLRQVWQNTTSAQTTWDSPLTEDFFRVVREVNASLPQNRRLRVWLGDPPIDWESIHTNEDYRPWVQRRDSYPAGLIRSEVLAKNRRALVLYGQMHSQRKDLLTNFEASGGLFGPEGSGGARVFSIWTANAVDLDAIQADVTNWRRPSLAILKGTVLGAADFTVYYPFDTPRFDIHSGNGALVPRDQWKSVRMEDQFDSVLYLGPKSALTHAQLSPALCSDADYMDMRARRIALAGLPPSEMDRLRQDCSARR